ncbi:MAG: 4'-phosphopantetheinyl transferase superfamily protein [Acidimicrobiia bacterium]
MPRIEATANIDCSIDNAFSLSQTFGLIRRQWDPFVVEENLLYGATKQGKDVETYSRSKYGITMISKCISFKPPSHIGMKMVKGPWFFSSFSGGWNFVKESEETTSATWRYNFTCKPKLFRFIMHPIGKFILKKDIEARLKAFTYACENKDLLNVVTIGDTSISIAKEQILEDKHDAGKKALSKTIFNLSQISSISHGKKTAYAASADKNSGILGLGIDFEEIRDLKPRAAKFYLTLNELEKLNIDSDEDRIKLWTIKEAIFKAAPNNNNLVLRDFEITQLNSTSGFASQRNKNDHIFEFVYQKENDGILSIAICKKSN